MSVLFIRCQKGICNESQIFQTFGRLRNGDEEVMERAKNHFFSFKNSKKWFLPFDIQNSNREALVLSDIFTMTKSAF